MEAVGDTVKDGIKNTVRAPLVKAATHAGKPSTKKPEDPDGLEASPHPIDNFFMMQHDAITALHHENRLMVNRHERALQHMLREDPGRALRCA